MTLFINCLFPIEIENWGPREKEKVEVYIFLVPGLEIQLEVSWKLIILVGKTGLAKYPAGASLLDCLPGLLWALA